MHDILATQNGGRLRDPREEVGSKMGEMHAPAGERSEKLVPWGGTEVPRGDVLFFEKTRSLRRGKSKNQWCQTKKVMGRAGIHDPGGGTP